MNSKRVFDFVMAFFGLILISPVFAVVSLINKLSGNDVFFIQQRVGDGSKPFPPLVLAK